MIMKTKKWIFLFTMMAGVSFFFTSCEKSDTGAKVSEEELATAEDNALMETLLDDAINEADLAVLTVDDWIYNSDGSTLKSATVDSCPVITVDHPDSTFWPKVITVDYGDLCVGLHDRTRSGKIIITITGRYMVPGSRRTVELVDYYVDGVHVEGTRTTTNEGRNDAGNLVFSTILKDGKITKNDTTIITREYERYREWVAGEETRNRWDDVFFITGNGSGTTFCGHSYEMTITSPLERARSCRFIKSGTVSITIDDNPPITLDYGDGTCDNIATITNGDDTREIELGYHPRTCDN